MANINFFSLGGSDEKGKNCFVIEIDHQYIIYNLGIIPLNYSKLGINKILPDFSWIEKNRSKIAGIIIGNPKYANIGSLQYINSIIGNVPIFTSSVGSIIINNYYNKKSMQNIKDFNTYNIKIIKPMQMFTIGKVSACAFNIFNSIPGSLGFVLKTNDGDIVLVDDFIYCNDDGVFNNQISLINRITKNNNLALIVSVGNVSLNSGFTAPNHDLYGFIKNIIANNNNRRHIIAFYDHDLFLVQKLISIAKELQIPFVINNNVFFSLFNSLVNEGIFDIKNLLLTPINKINEIRNGIILITGNSQKMFTCLDNVVTDNDLNFKLDPNDQIILAFPTLAGYELIEANIVDKIANRNISWVKIPKTYLELKPSLEDHKTLVCELKPKYLIPAFGLYMNFINYINGVKNLISNKNNVILLKNAEKVNIINAKFIKENKYEKVNIKEKYISGIGISDFNPFLLNERKLMSENGVVVFSAILSLGKEININCSDMKLFGVISDNDEFSEIEINGFKNELTLLLNNFYKTKINELKINQDQKIDWSQFDLSALKKDAKNIIKKQTEKFFEKKYAKTPLVLCTIVDLISKNLAIKN